MTLVLTFLEGMWRPRNESKDIPCRLIDNPHLKTPVSPRRLHWRWGAEFSVMVQRILEGFKAKDLHKKAIQI